jgi:beta-lactamase regulating signal transducer with metallopeptidase domain/ketosteroid isomerase-like protein
MFPFFSFFIPDSRVWLEFILDMTLKSIFILGVAFIILFIGKRASFITRHLVLNLAILSILIVPLFSYILPKWEISLLPPVLPPETTTVSFEGIEKFVSTVENLNPDAISDSHLRPNKNNRPEKKDTHWTAWLFVFWIVGATGVFAWSTAGIIGTRRIVKKACPVEDNTLNNLALSSAKKLGIKRKIRLIQSQKAAVPLTCGWLHPIIVVPEEIESWPMKRKEIVLLHEMAHIKRADFLLNLITLSVSVIYWFNPLVWIALKQLAIERERASDDCVLALGTKASEYALHLVEIARRLSSMKWLSPVGITMAKKSNLEVRIMSILSNKKPRIRIKPLTLVFIVFLAVSLMVPLSSLHTWAQEQEKQKEELPDKEAVKKALKEFYKLIESMDFSRAIEFFAKLPDFPAFEKHPFVILEKKKGLKKWAILSLDEWKDISVDSDIKSIGEKPDYFFVTESLIIKGTDKHGKTHIIVNNPEHTLILVKKNGHWKIRCDDSMDSVRKIIKETEEEKESKKVGIVFTSEGISYLILESKPLLKADIKPYIIKVKKGTKIKDKESELEVNVVPCLKKEYQIVIDVIPHLKLAKSYTLKLDKTPLVVFEGKPTIKIDENFVLVLDKKHALKLNIKPTLNIRKEILEKIKEKKKKETKINTQITLAETG